MINHYKNSMIFRIGGDEFVIITEGVSEDEFIKMSKEGKKLFEKDNLAAIGYRFYRKIDNLDYCIHQCDELMYSQKRFMKEST
jgi:GGDEF domain-containing protein